ncbi:hypothetical protein Terro_3084 [Terriglobus roseus DSM 18391]|uniref:Uncharacterized protein n=1 Tax=Terriglobus roseus (strain DSM 18391 / NRRL B-41598 / KBS 63) TaxID=926566 RepID=I3ZJ97_TERRK|nr:hypothetical protein Terro_3084 [Terriglobus roseus DSM 18391]
MNDTYGIAWGFVVQLASFIDICTSTTSNVGVFQLGVIPKSSRNTIRQALTLFLNLCRGW